MSENRGARKYLGQTCEVACEVPSEVAYQLELIALNAALEATRIGGTGRRLDSAVAGLQTLARAGVAASALGSDDDRAPAADGDALAAAVGRTRQIARQMLAGEDGEPGARKSHDGPERRRPGRPWWPPGGDADRS